MDHIHHHRLRAGIFIAAAAMTTSILWPVAAEAAVACTETALVQAVTAANAAGGGNVVLTPGCTYTLTTSHSLGLNGPNGLPVITTVVTLTGNANVITRSSGLLTLPFRIAEVSKTGNLTLKSVTLDNGLAVGSGGGILNFGAVTLTGSGLTNNRATGVGGGLANVDVPAPGTGTTATFTSSLVSANSATGRGGGIYNGLRGTLTVTSSPVQSNRSLAAPGGGVAAVNSTATTITTSPVSANHATLGAGGVYRLGGVITITASPITGNTPNNCVGSSPAVPACTA